MRKRAKMLFVLLIEDELGLFSYAERFAMAVEGTKDLPNVRIVTGGPFQATRNVFREYFVQVEPSDIRESAVVDTQIFAEAIAKRLGITRRFLGDERHNPKMQFFNVIIVAVYVGQFKQSVFVIASGYVVGSRFQHARQ